MKRFKMRHVTIAILLSGLFIFSFQNCAGGFVPLSSPVSSTGSASLSCADGQQPNAAGECRSPQPAPPVEVPKSKRVSQGMDGGCAIVGTQLKCWGGFGGAFNQFPGGAAMDVPHSAPIVKFESILDFDMRGIGQHCRITTQGALICSNFRVDLPTAIDYQVAATGATSVVVENYMGCAMISGQLKCWLNSNFLPTNTYTLNMTPMTVPITEPIRSYLPIPDGPSNMKGCAILESRSPAVFLFSGLLRHFHFTFFGEHDGNIRRNQDCPKPIGWILLYSGEPIVLSG